MTAPKGSLTWDGAILAAIERVKEPEGSFTYETIRPELGQIIKDTKSTNKDPWEHLRNWLNYMAREKIIQRSERGHFRIAPTFFLERRIVRLERQLERQMKLLEDRIEQLEDGAFQ